MIEGALVDTVLGSAPIFRVGLLSLLRTSQIKIQTPVDMLFLSRYREAHKLYQILVGAPHKGMTTRGPSSQSGIR
jgi:hypothetical protein